jgi:hypothetical protein
MWQVDSARAAIGRARADMAGKQTSGGTGLALWLDPNIWWSRALDPSDPRIRVER